jgi:site-specific DNA-methyltransferase (cytosine-N4-specific)
MDRLRELPAGSVQTCVTSPPYWNLRDYVVAGQIGLEETPEEWVAKLVAIFAEVRRVLRDDGTIWVNLGDSYAGSRRGLDVGGNSDEYNAHGQGQAARAMTASSRRDDEPIPRSDMRISGLKPKDLVGQPWRAAFALQADGWYLRQDIIWHKLNPMPESVRDRCTKAHEYVFLMSKSERYFFDADAISEVSSPDTHPRLPGNRSHKGTDAYAAGAKEHRTKAGLVAYAERQRGKRPSGWATDGEHSALALQRPGAHRKDQVAHAGKTVQSGLASQVGHRPNGKRNASFDDAMAVMPERRNRRDVWSIASEPYPEAHFATFPSMLPRLCILAGSRVGDAVLDPFAGSGTTLQVALELGRAAIGVELNPEYVRLIERRLSRTTLGLQFGVAA